MVQQAAPSAADIGRWFTYHAPTPAEVEAMVKIRAAAKELAYCIAMQTPAGPDQSVALRKLRECVMTANAAIVCDPNRKGE